MFQKLLYNYGVITRVRMVILLFDSICIVLSTSKVFFVTPVAQVLQSHVSTADYNAYIHSSKRKRTRTQTWSLTKNCPYNLIVRTTLWLCWHSIKNAQVFFWVEYYYWKNYFLWAAWMQPHRFWKNGWDPWVTVFATFLRAQI